MVGDARPLILLPLETRQVAPDNTVPNLVPPYSTDNRSKGSVQNFWQTPPHPFHMGVPPPPRPPTRAKQIVYLYLIVI